MKYTLRRAGWLECSARAWVVPALTEFFLVPACFQELLEVLDFEQTLDRLLFVWSIFIISCAYLVTDIISKVCGSSFCFISLIKPIVRICSHHLPFELQPQFFLAWISVNMKVLIAMST